MTHHVTITTDELTILLAALAVVTPSGGGSCARSLSGKLNAGVTASEVMAGFDERLAALSETFRHNVISEYVEAVGDNHPELAQLVTEQMREWPSSAVDA